MNSSDDTINRDDSFNLSRFITDQARTYDSVISELRNGQKRTHWMWFIFPQIDGLGRSPTARLYAIKSIEEARQYLGHSVLGTRLVECTEAILAIEGRPVSAILGYPDDLKLKSSMTLFASVAGNPDSSFNRVIDKYFHGEPDERTLQLLESIV